MGGEGGGKDASLGASAGGDRNLEWRAGVGTIGPPASTGTGNGMAPGAIRWQHSREMGHEFFPTIILAFDFETMSAMIFD